MLNVINIELYIVFKELKTVKSGKKVLCIKGKYAKETKKGQLTPFYIPVEMWESDEASAKLLADLDLQLIRGDKILVIGELRDDSWKERKNRLKITANRIFRERDEDF